MGAMETQALIDKLNAGEDLSDAELVRLNPFALAAAAGLPSRSEGLDGFMFQLRRALELRRLVAPIEAGQAIGLGLVALLLLAVQLAGASMHAYRTAITRRPQAPQRLPAAMAGVNLSPRLLPIPHALLAG